MTDDATPTLVGSSDGLGPVDRATIDCWRVNYSLDKTPHELYALWHSWAPPGAVLALKAAIGEIERLRDTLAYAEAALADIGDADREPGDDLAWCEARAAGALPRVRAVVAALALACAGCSVGERTDAGTPKGWRTFVAAGNHFTHVVPVTMEDGTRCVVTFGNGDGRGVSCDWSSAK